MATEIIMPKAGMAMEEGTIVKWLKAEGDVVEQGEPLLEILTDKVNMEVEAQVSGTLLKILKQEGDVVPVIQTIGYIGAPGEILEEAKAENTPSKEVTVKNETSNGNPSSAAAGDSIASGGAAATNGNASKETGYDVVVIGGGPAGYVAAIKAAQLGGKVALVEQDVVGGTCLNRGCIPTKTYLKNAEILDTIRHASQRGIHLAGAEVSLDMDRIVAVKNEVVKTLTTGVAGLLRSYGVTTYHGIGRITREKKVSVDGKELLETKNIIIAGGSNPSRLKIPGMESSLVLTSDEILDLKEVPKHLAIIGGGVIGIELATVFAAYGSKVTIIELEDRLAPFMDGEISAELRKYAEKKGIILMTGTKLEKLEERDGTLLITTDKEVLEADKALLSIGRVADLEALGELELETERGKIKVNERMETSEAGVYAAGDITGKLMLAHAAFKMGEIAAANAMGGKEAVDLRYTPSAIYTSPEIGSVGLTEEAAKAKYEVSVGKFYFGANGRALASGEGTGFVKVLADKKYGQILGVHIVGPAAAELINEAAALMSMEITVHELSEIIHGHPTFSEALMEAAADCLQKCIHKPRPSKSGQ
ncbi:dihydrolipoyl dehydrogenase [Anoxybacterium hadale]|uniref:Dihydrolipoyl dehydrogenase n=1 Tax=Anoxybacterium hadale TaxID=3408580 RepID=A0ACD1AFW7_9FIRM|nr:dihydrolipoyl dehydrogenase [Clostridiales bacterium]